MMKKLLTVISLSLLLGAGLAAADQLFVQYPGGEGAGKGKHVVLIAGDEEYRSEECLPMLGKILSQHHGFKCTVLFSVTDGVIDPNNQTSLTNPAALDEADAIVMLIRFRKWPADVMAKFEAAMNRGVPVVALRTSTHAFRFKKDKEMAAKYNLWGKDVLGEKWVSHWGVHKKEATRGVIETANAKHPILNGVKDVFGDSDVYEAAPPKDATILLRGQVLKGMKPTDEPADYIKTSRPTKLEQPINDPMMPVLWTRELPSESGTAQRIVTNTMGAATDFASEDLRRAVVNSVFWGLEMEVPEKAKVDLVGDFVPTMYGFGGFKKGVKPSAHALNAE